MSHFPNSNQLTPQHTALEKFTVAKITKQTSVPMYGLW